MPTLEELHNAYMKSRDDFDNYNVDDDYEAQQINDYYNSGDEVSDVHWQPVAKNVDLEKNIIKRKIIEKFNRR